MKQGRPVIYTKREAIAHAIELAHELGGYTRVTRELLSKKSGMSEGQISNIFGTMIQMRRAIVSAAIAKNDLIIIAQGIVAGESKAVSLPTELKRQALESIL